MKNNFKTRNYIIITIFTLSGIILFIIDGALIQILISSISTFFMFLFNLVYQDYEQKTYEKKKSNLFNKFNQKKLISLYKLHPHSTIEKIKNLYNKAEEYEINQQYNQALYFLEKALKHNSDPKFVKSQLPLLYSDGKIKEAIEYLIHQKISSDEERIENLKFQAIFYKKIKEFKKCKNCLIEVNKFYKTNENEKVICLIDLIECNLSLDEIDEAYDLLTEVIELIKKTNYHSGLFYLLNTYIAYYLEKDDLINLLKQLSISANLFTELKEVDLDIPGSTSVISICQFLEQTANALRKFKHKTIPISEKDIELDKIMKYAGTNPKEKKNDELLESIIELFKIHSEKYLNSMEI